MATSKTQAIARDAAKRDELKAEAVETLTLAQLVTAFHDADQGAAKAEADVKDATVRLTLARVIRARNAYRTAVHAELSPKGKPNYAGAARTLGIPRNTLRPYIDAGAALLELGHVWENGDPSAEAVQAYEKFMDETERARQAAIRAERKAKREAGKADKSGSGEGEGEGKDGGVGAPTDKLSAVAEATELARQLAALIPTLRKTGQMTEELNDALATLAAAISE
jgi:hypothetical protein